MCCWTEDSFGGICRLVGQRIFLIFLGREYAMVVLVMVSLSPFGLDMPRVKLSFSLSGVLKAESYRDRILLREMSFG